MIWCSSFPVGAFVRPSSSSVARLCRVEIGLRECLDPSATILGDLFKPQKQRRDHRLGEFAPLQRGGDPMQASKSIGKLQVGTVGGGEIAAISGSGRSRYAPSRFRSALSDRDIAHRARNTLLGLRWGSR